MSSPVEIGKVIRGKYRIDRVLGEGGMGIVAAAWHLVLEQRVAIKFLRPELIEHPEVTARFLREARAASRIESDHVARVIDVDALDDGVPFMVLEYLEGSDLSNVRGAGGGGLPVETAVDYVLQACRAVAEAHAHGIVHRDLKPANLFLAKRRDGVLRVKVLDFGISKVTGAPGSSDSSLGMTQAAVVMGSIEYMSPEQMLSSRDVDARTDIWALGVILFELITGRVPFPGETLTQVCALVMSTEPPRIRALRPDVPEGLEQVILWCLTKDRDRRIATVDALVAALQPFAPAAMAMSMRMPGSTGMALPIADATRVSGQTPVSAMSAPQLFAVQGSGASRTSTTLPSPAGSAPQGTIGPVSTTPGPFAKKKSSAPVAAVVAAGLVAVAAVVFFVTRGGDPRPAASGSPPSSVTLPTADVVTPGAPVDAGAPVVTPVVAPAADSAAPTTVPAGSAAPSDRPVTPKKPALPRAPVTPPPPPRVVPPKAPVKPSGGGID